MFYLIVEIPKRGRKPLLLDGMDQPCVSMDSSLWWMLVSALEFMVSSFSHLRGILLRIQRPFI